MEVIKYIIRIIFVPYIIISFFVFFFFQAEDGIRDTSVTGVQTCALPICTRTTVRGGTAVPATTGPGATWKCGPCRVTSSRSEERRVGKECRSRWGGLK